MPLNCTIAIVVHAFLCSLSIVLWTCIINLLILHVDCKANKTSYMYIVFAVILHQETENFVKSQQTTGGDWCGLQKASTRKTI